MKVFKKRSATLILIVLTVILVSTNLAMATKLYVSSATIAKDDTALIKVQLVNYTENETLNSFSMKLIYDSNIINVIDVESQNLTIASNINNAVGYVTVSAATAGVNIDYGSNYTLFTLTVKALRGDGSKSPLNVSTYTITLGTQVVTFPIINGTVNTIDETPPTITFNKVNGSIVGSNVNVTATLYDLCGVNPASIAVYINNTKLENGTDYVVTKINDTTWKVQINTNVSRLLGVSLPHSISIKITASDVNGNSETAILNVIASNIGFFNPYPSNNEYLNTSSVNVSVRYSQINPSTIRLYFDGINETGNIVIDQQNSTVIYKAINVGEGKHTVKVVGVGVDGSTVGMTWTFTVDLTKPKIKFFTVKDSDGDGFIEKGETLTAYWNVADANFDKVEILYNGNIVKTENVSNGSVSFSINDYGGYITLRAYDKAGNCNESSNKYYVYNNYVAYVVRSTPKTVAGLNLTKVAVLDYMDPSIVTYSIYDASGITLPLQNVERFIIPGSKDGYKIVVDGNANKTLSRFPDTAVILSNGTMLDFYIKAPAKGLIMVAKLNNSYAKDLRSINGFSLEKLSNLMEYVYIFDKNGWVKAKYDTSTKAFIVIGQIRGNFVLQSSMKDIIRYHSVDLSSGFKLSNYDANYRTNGYSVRPILDSGYYSLIVIDSDTANSGITGIDLAVPIVVLNGTVSNNKPSVSSVIVGSNLDLKFPLTFNAALAVMLKKENYNAKVYVNVENGIYEIYNATLSYDNTPLREITLFGHNSHVYVPKGMFRGAFTTKDTNVLNINTAGLDAGTYYIYTIAIDKNYLPLYVGTLEVTLKEDTLPPVVNVTIYSANSTAIVLHYKFEDNDLLNTVYLKAESNGQKMFELKKNDINAKVVEGFATLDVSTLNEGQIVNIYAYATDVAGNDRSITMSTTKPVTVGANQTKEVSLNGGVDAGIVSGANNTNVTILAAVTNNNESLNVPSPPLTPVKFIKVEEKVINGTVNKWILTVRYTDQEIKGLKESSLNLYFWDAVNKTWKNLKDYVGKKVDQTHFVYSYKHDMTNNYIQVVLSNLSVFALAGPTVTPTPTPTPTWTYAGGGGGGGYYVPSPPITAPSQAEYSTSVSVMEDTPVTIEIPSYYMELTDISKVTAKVGFSGTLYIAVSKVSQLPSDVKSPNYPTYAYIEIVLYISSDKKVSGSGSVVFRVSKNWLSSHGYSPDQVVLLRYDNGWKELSTKKVGEDSGYYYYKANTHFCLFAIAVKPKAIAHVTPTPTTTVTPIPTAKPKQTPTKPVKPQKEKIPYTYIAIAIVILIIAAVIAVAYLRKKGGS